MVEQIEDPAATAGGPAPQAADVQAAGPSEATDAAEASPSDPASAEPTAAEAAADLLSSYRRHNPGPGQGEDADLLTIFESAWTVGHDLWPRQLSPLLEGRDVLDMGSGNTFYGAVMRALGARSYLGIDPRLDLLRSRFRSRRAKGWVELGTTLDLVVRTIPRVAYQRPGSIPPEAFDLAVMHTVTEHLRDIEGVFEATARSLRPGGELWFLHDNFAAWAGHHMAPHSPRAINPDDPEQALVIDWGHLTFETPPGHPILTRLNRIRVDDLRAVTERHFEVLTWEAVRDQASVVRRLTPEVEARLPGYGREELLTRHIICHARKRDPSSEGGP